MPPLSTAAGWAADVIRRDAEAALLRHPMTRDGGSGPHAFVGGHRVAVFSSNDYLGLSVHPVVREAAAEAARSHGVGATGSRHLSGCHAAIDALERELADFEGAATATVAPTGYAANCAILQALGGPDAVVLSDERNHASIIDGCRLSRAAVEVYSHGDLDDLERRLRRISGRPVIVSDTVFSMDATLADVAGLHALARRHGAWLVLDEAHATGVLGPGGRGAAAEAGIDPGDEQVVRVVTMSKALGAGGGAICGDESVRSLLLQRGRALVFSTALPHPTVAAARAGLSVLRAESDLLGRLRTNACALRAHLRDLRCGGRPDVPILPVIVGDADRAVSLEAAFLGQGWLVQAVRPPSVPAGTSRLRLTVSALHTDEDIAGVARALLELLP